MTDPFGLEGSSKPNKVAALRAAIIIAEHDISYAKRTTSPVARWLQTGQPDKQIHTITANGKAALKKFVSEPIHAAVTRDEVLLRIFFGNFASKSAIKRELEAYLDRIRKERATMEATKARIEAHPGRKHEARRFQLLSREIKVAQIGGNGAGVGPLPGSAETRDGHA